MFKVLIHEFKENYNIINIKYDKSLIMILDFMPDLLELRISIF